MKRGWLLNLALVIVVASLALFVWLTPSREELAKQPLSTVRAAQARHITLERPGKPLITLEWQASQWQLTTPLRARADEFQVLRLLTILDAQPTAKMPAADLARFDLQSPVARLTIDGTEYTFGGINAVTSEQYVMRGDLIYAVELRHGAALPVNAGALIRRALLGENEQPVTIALPDFSVRQSGGRWTMTPETGAGADDLQRYVDQWRHASAAQVEPYDQRPPLGEIHMTLRDGATVTFAVLQYPPQLVLWRRDAGLQYLFMEAAGKALLGKPQSAPEHIK